MPYQPRGSAAIVRHARPLYIASTNPGKLRDFAVAADSGGRRNPCLARLERVPPPRKMPPTFEGNAAANRLLSRLLPGEIVGR